MFEVQNLAREAERRIKLIDDINHDLFLRPFAGIKQAISFDNLNVGWSNYSTFLNHGVLEGLEHCANKISESHAAEEPLDEEELKQFSREVDSLIENLTTGSLSDGLRNMLLGQLEHIRQSIIIYHIRGIDGLKVALESGLGFFTAQ